MKNCASIWLFTKKNCHVILKKIQKLTHSICHFTLYRHFMDIVMILLTEKYGELCTFSGPDDSFDR